MQAETGWISMTGTDEAHMAKMPVALMDVLASHQLREGILLSLLQRQASGKGSLVHVSLFKSALSALVNQASNYLMSGIVARPIGTLHPNIMPYGDLFYSSDNQVFMLALGSDHQFAKLCDLLDIPEHCRTQFQTNAERVRQRANVSEVLQRSFSLSTFSALSIRLAEANIPHCRVKKLNEVLEQSSALPMINERMVDGVLARSMSTIAFEITTNLER
jgi:crotonobetainyl-CoA:carnitine CoA-transferase CaiB-like acyl-CoA transferase